MCYLTGGSVDRIGINPNGSGVTIIHGGIPALFYMAGYLGAALFGAVALQVGRRTGTGRRALGLIGGIVLGTTILWIHPWSSPFGFVAGAIIGSLLLLGAKYLPESAAHFVASFLAIQVSLNALTDIRNLLYLTTATLADNDAVFMSKTYFMPPWFWAGLWALVAAGILFVSLRVYWRDAK
jgi:hypothetical protein